MTKGIQRLFAVLSFTLFLGLNASAATMVPVPIFEEYPLRVGAAVFESSSFSPFALTQLSGIAGVAYGFGGGFEGGFQIRGGAVSNALFQSGNPTAWVIGGDAMLRYLGNVSDSFYLGLQGRVGYAYSFAQANITKASNITAGVAIPFGVTFGRWVIYLMPELEFGGRKLNEDQVFGSLVGLGGALGVQVCFGGPRLYAEVKPKTTDISASNAFAIDAMLGMAFDM